MPESETGSVMKFFKMCFFKKPTIAMYNAFFSYMDKFYYRPNPVIGYTVVANK